jgi:flagellar protein FliO/FliZ
MCPSPRRSAWLGWTLLACLASCSTALGADAPARRFAEPAATSAVPAPAAGLAQVTLSLVLVLGAVFAAAWVMRRLRGVTGQRASTAIVVVAEQSVGPRERVVLLQVGGERVLIGVAQGSVRALHACRTAADAPYPVAGAAQ